MASSLVPSFGCVGTTADIKENDAERLILPLEMLLGRRRDDSCGGGLQTPIC